MTLIVSYSVGFSSFNQVVHNFTGVNWFLYTLTDWLGLVPIAVAFGFAVLGLVQLIIRKRLDRVDYNILAPGVFLYCNISRCSYKLI